MLDDKDKIILEHLFAYSRFTTKQLSKIAGLTQQAISYRVKMLEEKHYILRYDAIVNWNSLPLVKKIYYIRASVPDFVIAKISNENCVFGLNKVTGFYNLLVWCFFKSKLEQGEFEKKFKGSYWNSIDAQKVIFPKTSVFSIPLKLKIPNKKNKKVKLDEIDIKIMKHLANGHSRDSVRQIGEDLDIDYDVVYYRLKKLIKSDYFFRFAAQIGFTSIGLRLSAIKVIVKEKTNIGEFIEKLSQLDFFTTIVTDEKKDLHLHIFSENLDQYWQRVKAISEIFGESLEKLENIYFDETLILNRYPLEYLLDSRIKRRLI